MNSRVVVSSIFVAFSALLSACTNMPGSAGSAPKDALSRITQSQTLTLGYREDSKPFSYKAADGNPGGYSVELCKRVAAALQSQLKLTTLNVKWVPVTVATRIDAVKDGTVDIECGSTSRTLGREQQVDFSNATWVDGGSWVSLATAPVRRLTDLNGKRVGVIPGTTTEAALKALAARNIVPVFVPITTHTDGIAAVRDGRADVYATDRLILVGEALSGAGATLLLSDEYISVETYGLMMRRDADFRLAVNRALSGIYRSGEIVTVFRLIFGPNATPSPLLESAYVINALPE